MGLIETVKNDHKNARIKRDQLGATLLGTLIGEFDRKFVTTDEQALKTISDMSKTISSNPTDDSEQELTYLSVYLPKMLTKSEIESVVSEQVKTNGYTQMSDMKNLMSYFETNYNAQYDGKVVSNAFRENIKL